MPLGLALLTAALAALPLSSAGAQASKWLLVETQDGLTGAPEKDSRLILRAEHWAAGGATLVLACGDRLPSADRRTLLFNAAEPLHPFGSDAVVYAEVSFDGGRTQERHYWGTLQGSSAQVAFVGDSSSSVFSEKLFRKLLSADTVDVRYRALDRERTVRFDVRGLREALRHLSACRWPGVS